VWDRRTGAFLTEFSNGHEGRIFGVAMDCTKVSGLDNRYLYSIRPLIALCVIRFVPIDMESQLVSCGEDEVSTETCRINWCVDAELMDCRFPATY
jgi:hypothetical protein